ncbi:hypothetical protein LR48_Vigan06g112600 [Vigna angularis]|uniref:Uncharacterized protein n=1 Tax=Phaseolus angularis TaxID=3914 RepID=A0A0L9USG0_PHAAN|nr:hypothetical protein LR48_Vigan06g112600 [Vigna angularis]
MASSSGKRLKTMATKRKEKEPEQPHSGRFLSRKHEKHFRVVQDRRLLMERKVGMIPNFAPQFGEQVLGNDWGKLATYPAPAKIAVVKEFYANAKKIGDYPAENYLGYVRGHAIRSLPSSPNRSQFSFFLTRRECEFKILARPISSTHGFVCWRLYGGECLGLSEFSGGALHSRVSIWDFGSFVASALGLIVRKSTFEVANDDEQVQTGWQ